MIPQMEPSFDDREANALAEYMRSGGWLTEYKKTRELEGMIAEYVGSKHCIMMPSGTAALMAALYCTDLRTAGKHVIVPAFTMVASANAVRAAGGTPIFCDVDPETLCLSPSDIGARGMYSIGPRGRSGFTGGVVLVSLNGRSPDMDRVLDICGLYNLILIEDACQSLGSTWHGKQLGTFGKVGIFSFSTQKVVTTGNGGCCVTDDDEVAQRLWRYRNFGRDQGGSDDYLEFGINLKFTDLQAVVGIEQMKKLPWRVQHKRGMYRRYRELLRGVEQVRFLPTNLEETTPWFVDVLAEDAGRLARHLAERGIGTRRFYPIIPTLPFYASSSWWPNSQHASEHGLWLPSSSGLRREQIEYICEEIIRFYGS